MTGRAETQAPRHVLLTGVAGQIGTTLRQGWRGHDEVLRLTDMAEMAVAACGEEGQCGEEGMLADLSQVMDGIDAVIHLGGIPDEDTDERIRAAHRAGVRRMAFWSPWRFASPRCCRSRSKPAISPLGSCGVTLWHAHAFAAPDTSSLTVAGISANTQSWLKQDGCYVLGHQPQGNAKDYAAEVRGIQLPQSNNAERFQGDVFTHLKYRGHAQTAP